MAHHQVGLFHHCCEIHFTDVRKIIFLCEPTTAANSFICESLQLFCEPTKQINDLKKHTTAHAQPLPRERFSPWPIYRQIKNKSHLLR
jgi:hypothetical protein